MAKKVAKRTTGNRTYLTNAQFKEFQGMMTNTSQTLHRELLNRLLNSTQTNLDSACGYETTLTTSDYRTMYDRFGLAKRAVEIWPQECWQNEPAVYESEKAEETAFEGAYKTLNMEFYLPTYLYRVDVLSGIGSFGLILIGIDDGKSLTSPVEGTNEIMGTVESKKTERKILYLRVYDESVVSITKTQNNEKSKRFGYPLEYSIKYREGGVNGVFKSFNVHWSRVIHIADNRESSEVYGVSRLQALYNHLYDLKKVGGGSAEMFWKGGFPGYAFEISPEAAQLGAELDTDSIKEQMTLWASGLQRWLSVTGVTTKSLQPQVSDPTGHVELHLKLIALGLGVPYRVLLGSEEAKLASVQDKRTWNGRVMRRQNNYLSPLVVSPFVNRLIGMGCLPQPERYSIVWPDLNVSTEDDIAKVALNRTDAFSKYVAGGVDNLIPPRQYFTEIHKLPEAVADNILEEQGKYESELNPEPESEPEPIPRQTKPQQVQGA